jgi:hypothetical protein
MHRQVCARDALYLALAGLVRDGVIDQDRAVEMGRGVLRECATTVWKEVDTVASAVLWSSERFSGHGIFK